MTVVRSPADQVRDALLTTAADAAQRRANPFAISGLVSLARRLDDESALLLRRLIR